MRIQIALLSLLTLLCLMMVVPATANEVNIGLLYSNGPCNCYAYAWQIQNGNEVSDSFIVGGSGGFMTSFTFGAWVAIGDQPMMVSWSIGTSAFGSDIGSGTANLTNSSLVPNNGSVHNGNLNGSNFAVFDSTASGLGGPLTAGNTYWFTLSDGVTQNGGFMGWDENDGFGCPPRCSLANYSSGGIDLGPIPSEDPEIYAYTNGSTTPEPGSAVLFGSAVLVLGHKMRRKLRL